MLVEEFKRQLRETSDTVLAQVGNSKRQNPKAVLLRAARKSLMKELGKRNIGLESHMIQIGAKTLKYEPRVTSDPDPDPLGLGEKRMMEESESSDSES